VPARVALGARAGVVDPELRVIGVRSLRVADASVMPTLPSGNTHATCVMIGERTAAFILDELQRSSEEAHSQAPGAEASSGAATRRR
jgi:choline dehydrogenase-like flavoprotein